MKLRTKSIPPIRLEMTPLMDIVFLLLVFFIYSMMSMAVHHGKQVELPQSGSAAALELQEAISITIQSSKDGVRISVDDEASFADLNQLQQILEKKKAEVKDGKEPDVQLFADKSVDYQELFRVLDIISKARLSRISLQAVRQEP
jgi:biopolymer transport protein ExbD